MLQRLQSEPEVRKQRPCREARREVRQDRGDISSGKTSILHNTEALPSKASHFPPSVLLMCKQASLSVPEGRVVLHGDVSVEKTTVK